MYKNLGTGKDSKDPGSGSTHGTLMTLFPGEMTMSYNRKVLTVPNPNEQIYSSCEFIPHMLLKVALHECTSHHWTFGL